MSTPFNSSAVDIQAHPEYVWSARKGQLFTIGGDIFRFGMLRCDHPDLPSVTLEEGVWLAYTGTVKFSLGNSNVYVRLDELVAPGSQKRRALMTRAELYTALVKGEYLIN